MNWISVEDIKKLPDDLDDVLFTDGKEVFKGYKTSSQIDDYIGWFSVSDRSIYDVTHWMRLPELPQ